MRSERRQAEGEEVKTREKRETTLSNVFSKKLKRNALVDNDRDIQERQDIQAIEQTNKAAKPSNAATQGKREVRHVFAEGKKRKERQTESNCIFCDMNSCSFDDLLA